MNILEQNQQIQISSLDLSNEESYLKVSVDEATSTLQNPGEPVLPKITKTFILPLGSKITDINIESSKPINQKLNSFILPANEPVIDGQTPTENRPLSQEVYQKDSLYPDTSYNTQKSVGLKDGEHVLFYSVHYYPIRYNPVENTIYHSEEIDINLQYTSPSEPVQPQAIDDQDLMIIYPEVFSEEIQPLIEHKNNFGMRTYGKTLEEIYTEYSDGADDQEKIKLAIKDGIETNGITFVMLVGGIQGQSGDWYLPVRYAHSADETYLSDLYYADIYKDVEGSLVFEDWDSNGNGKFAEWSIFGNSKDTLDGAPDIYVGRLACRSEEEVTTVVDKIINYEETRAAENWFKHMLLIGGDTYPYDGTYTGCEAEIDTNLSASHMDGFTFTRLWASTGTLTGQSVVEDAINDGAGFIHMAGHANPASLVTHPPFQKEEKITIMQMFNVFDPLNLNPDLNNKEKLPVIVVGGCHNSQFNVSLSNIVEGIKEYGLKGYFFGDPFKFFYMEWVPECWSWWLTSNPEGGAIATMGNTGLGMGIGGEDYVTGLDGWLLPRFFYHYGQEGEEFVGMAQSSAITDYVNEFDINSVSEDRQMIQQWALLGDPSLMIGGYES
ncbi:MAG: peptidase C25 [Candidatus Thermoplasmatota archaeon]|nr:peptidase C25 [Candidatus Thermoplasmatota archaeon]MBS3801573.1 peptidase C25 [Candidatus Thermoplasmatota archaeon]